MRPYEYALVEIMDRYHHATGEPPKHIRASRSLYVPIVSELRETYGAFTCATKEKPPKLPPNSILIFGDVLLEFSLHGTIPTIAVIHR